MKSYKVSLESVDKVKNFVQIIGKFNIDIDLRSDRYIIDAKSIMGVFSLDLSKILNLDVHTDDDVELNKLRDALKDFIVD